MAASSPSRNIRSADRARLLACAAPAGVVFLAFWLLPMARLALLPASKGWETYFIVLTSPRYLTSLSQTVLLSLVVTVISLAVSAAVGLYLGHAGSVSQSPRRAWHRALLAVLTLPLSFPGVVIGFFIILLGGRQGLLVLLGQALTGQGRAFAYGLGGLVMAYVYFSLPRCIAAYTAAVEGLDHSLEEAARSLGAGFYPVLRDVWLPALWPTTVASGAIVFATSMGAFGTAFTLSTRFEVLPVTIYDEFTNYASFALAASLSLSLGLVTWGALMLARLCSGRNTHVAGMP
ncbi:ABC transporter permease [Megalodesulfovibrio paquesii]